MISHLLQTCAGEGDLCANDLDQLVVFGVLRPFNLLSERLDLCSRSNARDKLLEVTLEIGNVGDAEKKEVLEPLRYAKSRIKESNSDTDT